MVVYCYTVQHTHTFPLFSIVHRIKPDGTAVKYESEVRTVDAFEAFVKETLA
jgi:hypothetical protein